MIYKYCTVCESKKCFLIPGMNCELKNCFNDL